MHPILARGGRLALYLALWTLVGALLAALIGAHGRLNWTQSLAISIPLAVAYAFFCLSAWYVSRSMPLAATGVMRILVTALTAAVLTSTAWLALSRVWLVILAGRGMAIAPPPGAPRLDEVIFGSGVLLYLLSLAVSYLLGSFEQARATERRGLEVQVLAREAELRSLRAQIDPHFLFNSLHSISALTSADPGAARHMCVLLADFLRDSLSLGPAARITVAQELTLARRFLEIERVRFGERLRFGIEVSDAAACLVPPLLLQPIVENAVTHGVTHLLEGGTITMQVSRTASLLTIVVDNPCDPDRQRRTGPGVGLANVRARLRALHGSDGRLTAGERDGRWRVEITLPAEESA